MAPQRRERALLESSSHRAWIEARRLTELGLAEVAEDQLPDRTVFWMLPCRSSWLCRCDPLSSVHSELVSSQHWPNLRTPLAARCRMVSPVANARSPAC